MYTQTTHVPGTKARNPTTIGGLYVIAMWSGVRSLSLPRSSIHIAVDVMFRKWQWINIAGIMRT